MTEENLGESLYNLLAELLNSKQNRKVLDSIRGEYGVLRYLSYVEDRVSAGMEGERKLAESLGIPVLQISAEEIQEIEISPTQGMVMGCS